MGAKFKIDDPFQAMLCEDGSEADLDKSNYVAELKVDGMRLIAERTSEDGLRIYSRRGLVHNLTLPEIFEPLSKIRALFRLDGEVVYIDSEGHHIFAGAQKRTQISNPKKIKEYKRLYPVGLYIWDILMLNNQDFTPFPYTTRREILERFYALQSLLCGWSNIRLIPTTYKTRNTPRQMYEWAVNEGFEGVVLKKNNGQYKKGKRSENYLKVKIRDHTIYVLKNNGKI